MTASASYRSGADAPLSLLIPDEADNIRNLIGEIERHGYALILRGQ